MIWMNDFYQLILVDKKVLSGEYYHDILWRTTGQLIEEPLLWKGDTDRWLDLLSLVQNIFVFQTSTGHLPSKASPCNLKHPEGSCQYHYCQPDDHIFFTTMILL